MIIFDEVGTVDEVVTTFDEVETVDKVVVLDEAVAVLKVVIIDEECTVGEAVTVTVIVETVVVTAVAVTALVTNMVDAEPITVEVALTVVVEGVIERQEQAVEIADEAKAVRYEGIGILSLRSSSAGVISRLAWIIVVVVVAVTDLCETISVMMIGKFRGWLKNEEKRDPHSWCNCSCGRYRDKLWR